MYNDGNGVDVAKHPDNDLWVPEMIFGHLRTSTNYNKEEKKSFKASIKNITSLIKKLN